MTVTGTTVVRRALVAASAFAVLVTLAACSGTSADPDTGFQGAGGTVVGITVVKPADRKPAPAIRGEDLDGRPISLADYRGKTVVVNVWGSWCGPCVAETPALIAASKQLAPKNVQFLGIAVREDAAATKRFADLKGIPYPTISDPSSKTLLGFRKNLPASAIPTTYVIDSKGRVGARIVVDKTSQNTLEDVVEDVQRGS